MDTAAERSRAWRLLNPERYAQSIQKWRLSHPEKSAEWQRDWRRRHPGKAGEQSRLWQKQNPDKVKQYKREHPEQQKTVTRRRRAILQGCEGNHTVKQWLELKESYGNLCLCCKRDEKELAELGLKIVPDHIKALSEGGSNDISNIQPLCHGLNGCNNKKLAKYMDYRGEAHGNDNHNNYTDHGHNDNQLDSAA